MFICAICKKSSAPREKCNKVVTEMRVKRYADNKVGTEIVKEINVCSADMNKYDGLAMAIVAAYSHELESK